MKIATPVLIFLVIFFLSLSLSCSRDENESETTGSGDESPGPGMGDVGPENSLFGANNAKSDQDPGMEKPCLYEPIINNGLWNPDTVVKDEETGLWYSILTFSVCDPDDDLNGGIICINRSDMTGSYQCEHYFRQLEGGPPSAPDCENPATVEIEFIFGNWQDSPNYGNLDWCVNIQVIDECGMISEKLYDVCVVIP